MLNVDSFIELVYLKSPLMLNVDNFNVHSGKLHATFNMYSYTVTRYKSLDLSRLHHDYDF